MIGQDLRWVTRQELSLLKLPEADQKLVDLLVNGGANA
jgi:hypothetical protein